MEVQAMRESLVGLREVVYALLFCREFLFMLIALLLLLGRLGLGSPWRRRCADWSWGKTLLWVAGLLGAALYVAFFGSRALEGEGFPWHAFLPSLYDVLQAASIQAPVADLRPELPAGEALGPCFEWFYSITCLCATFFPIAGLSVVVTYLWKVLNRRRPVYAADVHDTIYLFSEVNENTARLARSILENEEWSGACSAGDLARVGGPSKAKRAPLIVFCGVTAQKRDDHADLIEALEGRGKSRLLVVPRSLGLVACDLYRRFPPSRGGATKAVHCFLFSHDLSKNVGDACRLVERLSLKAALLSLKTDAREGGTLRNYHVHCLHDNINDELVLDSLQRERMGKDDLSELELDAWERELVARHAKKLLPLARKIQGDLEVRLVNPHQERAWDLLTSHPLYEAFGDGAFDFEGSRKQLYVCVVGLGKAGLEVLKSAYWMGRMRDTELHVLGFDRDAEAIGARLGEACPEMMAEPAWPPRLEGGSGACEKLVRLACGDALTGDLRRELEARVPRGAFVYAVVCLGDDRLNLDVAIRLRRLLDWMRVRGRLDCDSVVAPLIYSNEVSEAAQGLASERKEPFRLVPFGQRDDTFSYWHVVESVWERMAVQMNGAYDECFAQPGTRGTACRVSAREVLEEYGEYEIKKLSNRTCVRHLPYRLHALGVTWGGRGPFTEHGEFDATAFPCLRDQELWLKELGLVGESEDWKEDPAQTCVDQLFFTAQESAGQKDADWNEDEWRGALAERLDGMRQEAERRYEKLLMLGELEHDRWLAFYRSHGWRDIEKGEVDQLKGLGIIKNPGDHQSSLMQRHAYMVPNEQLTERGATYRDDPYRYDWASVIETQRILSSSLLDSAHDAGTEQGVR